ncbi:hypothetical protein Hypma_008461 [Hypsizygus marmoreus]|uniref:Uncharacterized protein n=1 Tax=Hypsizygus marmoreus TaxID=39966 RepID=A0A369JVE9_HYPMA|nr:hypothetical protein Hypma_008461 [Hypsizygus marmoreus]
MHPSTVLAFALAFAAAPVLALPIFYEGGVYARNVAGIHERRAVYHETVAGPWGTCSSSAPVESLSGSDCAERGGVGFKKENKDTCLGKAKMKEVSEIGKCFFYKKPGDLV